MKTQTIAILMTAILALLFLVAPRLQKKEKEKSDKERAFFTALQAYRKSPSEITKASLLEAAKLYYGNDKALENLDSQFSISIN